MPRELQNRARSARRMLGRDRRARDSPSSTEPPECLRKSAHWRRFDVADSRRYDTGRCDTGLEQTSDLRRRAPLVKECPSTLENRERGEIRVGKLFDPALRCGHAVPAWFANHWRGSPGEELPPECVRVA